MIFTNKKKILLSIIICILLLIPCFSDETEDRYDDENKIKIDIDFESETTAEVGIKDNDDSAYVDLILDKNSPEFEQELELFIKIKNNNFKRFILGPYAECKFDLVLDYRDDNINNIFLEKHNGEFDTGVKIGYKFGRKKLKGSYFLFSIPFSLDYKLRYDEYQNLIIRPETSDYEKQKENINKFHTSLMLGTKLGFILSLKMKKSNMRFDIENYITIQKEVLGNNYTEGYKGVFIENENIIEYKIAPFNFINENVDVWINIYNKFNVSYNSQEFRLKDKVYLEIEWKSLDFFHLGYKPIQYQNSIRVPETNINDAYDQVHKISMEIWIGAGYEFFWAVFSYEPTLYSVDAPQTVSEINVDSVKPHIFTLSMEFKL